MVTNVDDAIDFLYSINEIGMNPDLERDVREYVASSVYYPKRSEGLFHNNKDRGGYYA